MLKLFILLVFAFKIVGLYGNANSPSPLQIWYNEPAEEWVEALPLGNGRQGAMVFGRVDRERIQLNEETVWTKKDEHTDKPNGYKHIDQIRSLLFDEQYEEADSMVRQYLLSDRMPQGTNTYQTLGDLELDFPGLDDYSAYKRQLDLNNAVARISFRADGVNYTREYFSSHPADASIIRLSADQPGQISFSASLSRPGEGENIRLEDDEIIMRQKVDDKDGVRYETRVKIIPSGGSLSSEGETISVKNADSVMLVHVAATDYRGEDPTALCQQYLEKSAGKDYATLKQEHIADYQELFGRVSLDLGTSDAIFFPTDQRLEALRNGASDPALYSLYFQFGRYLLISSSRPGCMPANLQGLWAQSLTPPWNADYHININLQMNYWPAGPTNLFECHRPFLEFIGKLRDNGRETARDLYGADGFVAHHTTDAWHFTTPQGLPQWGMWPMGAAWSATHLWEDFLFTRDTANLRNSGFDVMKEAALFLSDFLVEDPETGLLVSGPSMSPENTFFTPDGNRASVVMGPSMDHQIIHHLFTAVIEAAEVLDEENRFIRKLEEQLDKLTPPEIGSDGRIMEWSEELKEAEPGHRHMSHLYGLYPGSQFTWQETPELMEASRKVIEERLKHGGGHTGWSRAWMVNFFARLKDGQAALNNMRALLTKSTHPNLFDKHPPFQIDGNFGGTAGIAEMLLQSHQPYIELLPALPDKWDSGSVEGLRARGEITVDISWDSGHLSRATITSETDQKVDVRCDGERVALKLKAENPQIIGPSDF